MASLFVLVFLPISTAGLNPNYSLLILIRMYACEYYLYFSKVN
jgi:hypothetical protein